MTAAQKGPNSKCNVDLSAGTIDHLDTTQKLGLDFSKLAKVPFSVGVENRVNDLVQNSFQAIPESSSRCMIVTKLAACALDAGNSELMLKMQDTVDRVCGGPVTSTSPISKPTETATTKPSEMLLRLEQWKCIPQKRRGLGTDLNNTDPSRTQMGGGILFWSAEADSEALRCVQVLLSAGGDPNFTELEPVYEGYFGGPPLHLAISQQRWDMVELLLKNGADPKRRSIWNQRTALEVAQGYYAPNGIMRAVQQAAER
jgi:hypothetical protein